MGQVASHTALFARYGADNNGPTFAFSKSRNAALGGQTIVHDDDELGKIRFYGSDGNDFDNWAEDSCKELKQSSQIKLGLILLVNTIIVIAIYLTNNKDNNNQN